MNANPTSRQSRFLWFERAGHTFAVPMEYLQGVLSAPKLRPVPVTEPALTGIMVLREQVFPVLDPASLADFQMPLPVSYPIVVLLGVRDQPCLGLLAERVGKVVELAAVTPLRHPARLPAAFAGETKGRDVSRALVFDVPALADAMGMAEEFSSPAGPAIYPLFEHAGK